MKMKKCLSCKTYTFKEVCPRCNGKSVNPEPPRYSPEDKYGSYRRALVKAI